jgi:hypothetical protein
MITDVKRHFFKKADSHNGTLWNGARQKALVAVRFATKSGYAEAADRRPLRVGFPVFRTPSFNGPTDSSAVARRQARSRADSKSI